MVRRLALVLLALTLACVALGATVRRPSRHTYVVVAWRLQLEPGASTTAWSGATNSIDARLWRADIPLPPELVEVRLK